MALAYKTYTTSKSELADMIIPNTGGFNNQLDILYLPENCEFRY